MSCGNAHETPCDEVLAHLYEFIDRELAGVEVARLRQHLDECGPCLSEHDRDLILKSLMRRSCGQESAPDALRQRIMVSLTEIRVRYEG